MSYHNLTDGFIVTILYKYHVQSNDKNNLQSNKRGLMAHSLIVINIIFEFFNKILISCYNATCFHMVAISLLPLQCTPNVCLDKVY